jgi:HAD superfamily phosphoserine phosphatase-like hydrolase
VLVSFLGGIVQKLADVLNPQALAVIEPLLARRSGGECVCFDADGTLWRGDVGEDLLRFLVAEDRLPAHRGDRSLYARYERAHDRSPVAAYQLAVEVMAGLEEATLRQWCAEFFARRFLGRLFPFARPLLGAFAAAGYTPWIVSASPRWIVEAGAAALGVEALIAVDCGVDEGRLDGQVHQPVPAGQGKVALLKARGLSPVFAAGNGDLDLPMLELAGTRLVVAPWGEEANLLVRTALARGWPVQRG